MSQLRELDEIFIHFFEFELERVRAVNHEVFKMEFRIHKSAQENFTNTLLDIHQGTVDFLSWIFVSDEVLRELRTELNEKFTNHRHVIVDVIKKPISKNHGKKWRYADQYPEQYREARDCFDSLQKCYRRFLATVWDPQAIKDSHDEQRTT